MESREYVMGSFWQITRSGGGGPAVFITGAFGFAAAGEVVRVWRWGRAASPFAAGHWRGTESASYPNSRLKFCSTWRQSDSGGMPRRSARAW